MVLDLAVVALMLTLVNLIVGRSEPGNPKTAESIGIINAWAYIVLAIVVVVSS